MENKKCKDCVSFDEEPVKGWGSCYNDEIFQDASDPARTKPTEKTLFRYMDSERYGADFQVHENFGCVGFKKNE